MLDLKMDASLPVAIADEIERMRAELAELHPVERTACALHVAARLMTWASDLERMSVQFSRAA